MNSLPFQLGKDKPFIIKKYMAGNYVKGKWVKFPAIDSNAAGIVYEVLNKDKLTFLPEGANSKRVIRIFTNDEICSQQDVPNQRIADEIEFQGQLYRVLKAVKWDVNSFQGYEAYAMLIDSAPTPVEP